MKSDTRFINLVDEEIKTLQMVKLAYETHAISDCRSIYIERISGLSYANICAEYMLTEKMAKAMFEAYAYLVKKGLALTV